MKKIILLAGFLLLWVFPPKAWDQDHNYGNYGAGGAEYLRQMQQQTINKKDQAEKQQPQNKTDGLQQKQFYKAGELRDREAKQKQKGDLENDINSDNTK